MALICFLSFWYVTESFRNISNVGDNMNTGILSKSLDVQGTTGSLKLEHKEQADGPGGRTSKVDGIWTTESLRAV